MKRNIDVCNSGCYQEIMNYSKINQLRTQERYSKIVAINQQQNEEFRKKYRYFQLHKWEILKQIKQVKTEEMI